MKYIIQTSLFLLISFAAQAQIKFSFETADTIPAPNTTIDVDVKVEDFTNIDLIQMWTFWDSTVISYDTIVNFNETINEDPNSQLGLSHFSTPGLSTPSGQYPDGKLGLSWSSPFMPATLPDDAVLFTLRFNVVGDPCEETSIFIGDNNVEPKVQGADYISVTQNLVEYGAVSTPRSIMIAGDNCDGTGGGNDDCDLRLYIQPMQVEQNTKVTIPVYADGFQNVTSLQFGLAFDDTVLEYSGGKFVNVPTANSSIVPADGVVKVIKDFISEESANGASVDDGTPIMEFNFDVIGDVGSQSSLDLVDSGNIFIEIIVDGNPNAVICTDGNKVTVVEEVVLPVELNIADVTVNSSSFCIPVTTNNFNAISTLQFVVDYGNLTYTGAQNLNTDLGIAQSHVNIGSNGLNVSWTPPTGGGLTAPDGATLFEMCFTGECGQSYPFGIVGNPEIEITGEVGGSIIQVPYTLNAGTVSVDCSSMDPCDNVNIVLSTEQSNISCAGANDGSILLTATGGTSPYQCEWTNPAVGIIPTDGDCNLSDRESGTYSVIVTDANGCTANTSITITEPAALSVTTNITLPDCDSGATVTTNVTGGTSPYTYSWSGGLTGGTPTNVQLGTYSLTVTDANDCAVSTDVTVDALAMMIITGNVTNANCDVLGVIDVTITGGSGNYAYAWSDLPSGPFTMQDRSGLTPGVYTLTVSDNDTGCMATETFTVSSTIEALSLTLGTPINANCGNANGAQPYTITGGCPEYTCSVNGGASEPCTGSVDGLTPGFYNVVVTDGLGNTTNANFAINEEMLDLEISGPLTVTNATCNGGSNGSVSGLEIVGGCPSVSGEYACTITLPDGSTQSINCSELGNQSFTAGNYTLTVDDGNGDSASQEFSVSEPSAIAIGSNVDATTYCQASIDITASGGNAGSYSYSWSGPDSFTSADEDLVNLCPGTYSVTVTDSQGCIASTNIDIDAKIIITDPEVTSESQNSNYGVSCAGTCDGVVDATIIQGSDDYDVVITNTVTGANATYASFPVSNLCAGDYSLTVVDANGAESDPYTFVITSPEELVATIDGADVVNPGSGMSNGSITLSVTGGAGNYSYDWSPNVSNAITAENLAAGTYGVEVIDANGCSAIIMGYVLSEDTNTSACYEGSAVLTPNNDGANDTFTVSCIGSSDLTSYSLAMYDRWGNVVMESTNYNNDWAGTDLDNEELGEGVYFYVLVANFINGDSRIFKGSTTLLRD